MVVSSGLLSSGLFLLPSVFQPPQQHHHHPTTTKQATYTILSRLSARHNKKKNFFLFLRNRCRLHDNNTALLPHVTPPTPFTPPLTSGPEGYSLGPRKASRSWIYKDGQQAVGCCLSRTIGGRGAASVLLSLCTHQSGFGSRNGNVGGLHLKKRKKWEKKWATGKERERGG